MPPPPARVVAMPPALTPSYDNFDKVMIILLPEVRLKCVWMRHPWGEGVTRFRVCIRSHVSTMAKSPSKKRTAGAQVRKDQFNKKLAGTKARPPPDADVSTGVRRRFFDVEMGEAIMATCSTCLAGEENEWLRVRIRRGLDFAKSHGIQKHIANIKEMAVVNGAPQFTDVGQSFLHCDLTSGIVMFITLVRCSSTSHWMHIIATLWNKPARSWRTTKPHGRSDYGRNELCQHDFLELYWSHTGHREDKHVYMRSKIKNNLEAMVAPDARRLLVPIYLKKNWEGTLGIRYTGQTTCTIQPHGVTGATRA